MVLTLLVPTSVMAADDGGVSSVGTLVLDNKDTTTWTRIADSKYAVLNYNSTGNAFDFTLTGVGLLPSTAYSLIYFADPYPGTSSSRLLWTGNSNGSGGISVPDNINLGVDLPLAPDSNMVVSHAGAPDNYITPLGAKIWLVEASEFSTVVKGSTGTLTGWNPSKILFETNLVLYTDTNKPVPTGIPVTTTVTVPTTILSLGVSPVGGIAFGSVAINTCSPEHINYITLTNTGNVPIKVTAVPSAGFYTTSLKLDGIIATAWTVTIPVTTVPVVLDAQVCPLAGYTGTLSGSVAFIATFAP